MIVKICCAAQVWLSPWQVAHLLSIVHMVKENVPRVDPLLPDPSTDLSDSAEPRGHKPPSLTTQLRVTGVFEVPLLVVLCLVRALNHMNFAGMLAWAASSPQSPCPAAGWPPCASTAAHLMALPWTGLQRAGKVGAYTLPHLVHVLLLPAPGPSFTAAMLSRRLMHASSPAAGT